MTKITYHNLSVKQVLSNIKTAQQGLDEKEAKKRLKKYGLNKLPEEKKLSRLVIFLDQFKSPLIYILVIAAVISFFLKEFVDSGVIMAAVIVNTIIGFIQEDKANQAISQLKKIIEYRARVLRAGIEREINTEELVLGDILLLKAGDKIPADARLFEANNFQVNEASLTGESLPIGKDTGVLKQGTVLADRKNMVYMGTAATRGRAKAIVVGTGVGTHLGEIADLIKKTVEDKTPLQQKLAYFSKWVGLIVLALCLFILLVGVIQGRPFFEMFTLAVAVAVAAIPEGLVVAMTVILALGMQQILKQKALVRKLIAAETLGSVSVICFDKTGTLTEGKMAVSQIVTGLEKPQKIEFKKKSSLETDHSKAIIKALEIGLLCNNAVIENPKEELKNWKILGDPTESALLKAAIQAGLRKEELEREVPRLAEIPFDGDRKYMATLHLAQKTKQIIYVKGAPERVLEMSKFLEIDGGTKKLNHDMVKELKASHESLTRRGLRVLGIAYQNVKLRTQSAKLAEEDLTDLVFVGFMALKDPLRPETKETIRLCKNAGIKPVMITGDHKLTAQAIFQELGFETKRENILEGRELDKMSDEELKKQVKKFDIYARATPKHKIRIVDAWQAQGEVVAMTGDGVNDAPALKSADVGVALGSGTDVAKETSDIVLMDDNFSIIVAAVEQGRVIFDNIKKVILYLLSDSFTEVIIVVGSLLFGLPLPVLPAQILWVNFVEDGLPNFALAFEPGEKEVMKDPPRKKKEPILDKEMKILIFVIGIITDLVLFGLFYYLWKTTGDLKYTRTIIFTALGIDSLFYVFSCRSLRHSLWHKNPFSNKYLLMAVLVGFILLLSPLYVPFLQQILRTMPLGPKEWGIILVLALFKIWAIEITKWIFIVRHKNIRPQT